jgi:hypothetical protein
MLLDEELPYADETSAALAAAAEAAAKVSAATDAVLGGDAVPVTRASLLAAMRRKNPKGGSPGAPHGGPAIGSVGTGRRRCCRPVCRRPCMIPLGRVRTLPRCSAPCMRYAMGCDACIPPPPLQPASAW